MDPSPLTDEHRKALLDVVLTWASLDGALSMLLANVRCVSWAEGASSIRKLRGSAKISEIVQALDALEGGVEAARTLRKLKKKYEKFSKVRDHIAHSRCIGVNRNDPDLVVFLTFEKIANNELAMYQIPVSELERAREWGEGFLELLFRLTHSGD